MSKLAQKLERERKAEQRRHRRLAIHATTIVAVGAILGVLTEYHGAALVVEILGLYTVAVVA